jgi:hypothetical protein
MVISWPTQPQLVGHCKTYIISSMGHPRSNSVGLLVLWRAYNGRDIDIVLQVLRESTDLVENK